MLLHPLPLKQADGQVHSGAYVVLNVYDLGKGWMQANDMFSDVFQVGGAFHAAVEVYGREWSFGCEGITCDQPRSHEVHIYRESIVIGVTSYQPAQVARIVLEEMMPAWSGTDYHLFHKNCCSFSNSLCQRIVGQGIPEWVDRFPKFARHFSSSLLGFAEESVMRTGDGSEPSASPRKAHLRSDYDSMTIGAATEPTSKIVGLGWVAMQH